MYREIAHKGDRNTLLEKRKKYFYQVSVTFHRFQAWSCFYDANNWIQPDQIRIRCIAR